MENSKWQPGNIERVGKMERCLLGTSEIQVPEVFVENKQIFNEVVSQHTWNKVLSEEQRRHLMTFLPSFPDFENEERRESLRRLFAGDNFKFGNPLQKFQYKLKDGGFSPDIAKYSGMCRKMKQKDYEHRQQKYYSSLVKEVLLSRQRVFDQLSQLPADEPIKFEYVPPKRKESAMEHKVKRKYRRFLHEVRRECGVEETSSEEEEGSPVQRSKKQLFKSLNPVPSPEPVVPSVQATYTAKLEYSNGDSDEASPTLKRQRPISPPEITEDSYKKMLLKHRRRLLLDDFDDEEHPEFNTQTITLQDVMDRCQASRKGGHDADDDDLDFTALQPAPAVTKPVKVKKEKPEKRVRKKAPPKKICEMEVDTPPAPPPAPPPVQHEEVEEDRQTNVSVDNMDDDASSTTDRFSTDTRPREEDYGKQACFFSLLKNIILQCPDQRLSTVKLEERIRTWQESPTADVSPWVVLQEDWVDQVPSALKFLAGETIGMNVDSFIPFLEYKERAQQWHWIGAGRDSDDGLRRLCDHWLRHKEDSDVVVDSIQGSPPPARTKTGYIVRASTEEEKSFFHQQERQRFEEPHKACTYQMHGYESVVGPVKGVFSKKNDMTKAREHALLISNRPAYVTILTLVRDAVARLPNGEGTRSDICELLKDSQFLAPGITDAQINVVVSGALDRLHSEKDPCVKYDVNRKVWIYLHRHRSEEEFEKIHQAQAAALKAKKSLSKQKTPKASKKETASPHPGSSPASLKVSSQALGGSTESINVEDLSPQTASQAQILACTTLQSQQGSPRAATQQASPKSATRQASSGSSKSQGQSLTPAQLQLLQQAAAAQAAHVKAQAEAQAAKAQAQAQAAMAKAQGKVPPASSGITAKLQTDITSKLQKNITLSQSQMKVLPGATPLRPGDKTAPPNITITSTPEYTLQRPGSGAAGSPISISSPSVAGQTLVTGAPPVVTKVVTPATSVSVASAVSVAGGVSQAGNNPLVARLVQQMSGGQMVSVSNLLAAQRSLQGNQPRTTAAFKIQGGNVVHQVTGGKPIQITGKPMAHAKGHQLVQIGGGAKGQQTLGLIQTPQGTINIIPQAGTTGGVVTIQPPKGTDDASTQPSAAAGQATIPQSVMSQILSPAKSSAGATGAGGNVVVTQLAPGNITLRPGVAGSQGKVITQGQGGLVPAQFVLQQTTQGTMKMAEAQSTNSTSGATSILVSNSTGNQSQNLQMVRTVLSQQAAAGLKPGQATILISQPTLHGAGATGAAGGAVLPQAQLIQTAKPTGAGGGGVLPQAQLIQTAKPAGAGGGVLPQAQLIQTAKPTGAGLSQAQLIQTAKPAGVGVAGKTTAQPKQQPMYARIIAPPSNLNVKLAAGNVQGLAPQGAVIQAVGPGGQTLTLPNEAALLQTVNKLITVSGSPSPATVSLTSSPIATSQQILAAAAAGKAAQIKEAEKEKK